MASHNENGPLPLPLDNLGFRHRALNNKVNEALAGKVDFNTVKDEKELSEVDRFFKIDLAAKCKNLDYIIETLKSGDTLYATRALKKSEWLFGDEFSHIINPEYLETNIFPVTSERVKRIILKTMATRVRREDRAIELFKYFINTKQPEIAFKCLLFTSDSFKLEIMENHKKPEYTKIVHKKLDYFKFIIGKSLTLLEAYIKMKDKGHRSILESFRYLYPVNNVKYLELCEKYIEIDYDMIAFPNYSYGVKLDKELCIDIMKKYKDRVLANPLFYIDQIESDILIKNSTIDDVKVYIIEFLPDDANTFWANFFLQRYSLYLDVIPHSEKYAFLKNIFSNKYPGEDFEMSRYFYTQHYYQYMTPEEREEWAWKQINSDKQVLGVGKDYLWFKFIKFQDAFEEIKNYVIVTKEAERRKGIIKVLIYCAKNNRDLEILFKHYHRRHNNELRAHKEYFLNKVIDHHNVFEFDDACWNEFYKCLLGLELYNTLDYSDCNKHYKTIALFYHIVYEKDMPTGLTEYLREHFYPYTADEFCWGDQRSILQLTNKLTEQKRQFLYDFLFTFYIDRFKELKNETCTSEVNKKLDRYFNNVQTLMCLNNPYTEVAEVEKPTKNVSNPARKARKVDTSLSGRQLLRQLRKDKILVIDMLLDVQKRFENGPFNMDGFLKKLKIYFPGDVTKNYIALFEEVLTKDDIDQKSVEACVKAIFELSDENEIIEFMKKYAPEKPKIDHNEINAEHLRIQKAICKYACVSRPPVPLPIMLLYMKGDYVKFCLHLFNTYPAILPPSKCIEFVKALVDAPVSIQKHALRLAFKCFDAPTLKQISLDYWKKTKNVSIRCVLYKGLYNRLVERNDTVLYDALKLLTLDLHDTDQKVLFGLLDRNSLPNEYLGEFKEAAWTAVNSFKDKQPNIQRKLNLLTSIQEQIQLMREEFVCQIVEEHVQLMLGEDELYLVYSNEEISKLYVEKWKLTEMYILHLATTRVAIEKYLETTQFVVKKTLEKWNETYDNRYIYAELCCEFFVQLRTNSICLQNPLRYENSLPIFERFLSVLESHSSLFESYTIRWDLRLAIASRNVMRRYRQNFGNKIKSQVVDELLVSFSQEVAKLVTSIVNDKEYFRSYTEIVKNAISDSVKELLNVIYLESDEDQTGYTNKALLTFITGLIKFETVETYLLAIEILPLDCEECSSDKYRDLVNKINEYSNQEVKHALYNKLTASLLYNKLLDKSDLSGSSSQVCTLWSVLPDKK